MGIWHHHPNCNFRGVGERRPFSDEVKQAVKKWLDEFFPLLASAVDTPTKLRALVKEYLEAWKSSVVHPGRFIELRREMGEIVGVDMSPPSHDLAGAVQKRLFPEDGES